MKKYLLFFLVLAFNLQLSTFNCFCDQPKVAIFSQEGFPYYSANSGVTAADLVEVLKGIGVEAQILNAKELADSTIFNANKFKVFIYIYGNTFPKDAADSLRAFHQGGGCIIHTGVPFCHPCAYEGGQWKDLGHEEWFNHDRIGTGGFIDPPREGVEMLYYKENDPFNLPFLEWINKGTWCQALDTAKLSPDDELKPILGYDVKGTIYPALAIVKHKCSEFGGAIDVWTGQILSQVNPTNVTLFKELIKRSVAYLLKEKRIMDNKKYEEIVKTECTPPKPINNLATVSEPRPFSGVFPKSKPPVKNLIVLESRRYRSDFKLTLLSLQGIVNRKQPKIYLINHYTDEKWLSWMKEKNYVGQEERLNKGIGPIDMICKFKNELKGLIIYDPDMPATINVATMLSGIKDALIVSPRIAEKYKDKLNLPVLDDLRGKWTKNMDAYKWVFDNFWDKLNHHSLAFLSPSSLPLRDYLIEWKIPTIWIAPSGEKIKFATFSLDTLSKEEALLLEPILAKMPVNIPSLGYPCAEGEGVTLLAEFAKYLVGSTDVGNLSVHSGVVTEKFVQKKKECPSLKKDKVYVAFNMSDGDNLPVLTICHQEGWWNDPNRGKFPIGWGISPASGELMPDIMQYYYQTATDNDYFLAAVSGIGYTYPIHYGKRYKEREKIFDEFLSQTGEYMKKMDLQICNPCTLNKNHSERFAQIIPELTSLFNDYAFAGVPYEKANYMVGKDVPVFHSITRFNPDNNPEQAIKMMVSDIKNATESRPAFIHAFVHNWTLKTDALRKVIEELGNEYVFVRPDHLVLLYKEAVQKGLVVSGKERPLKFESLPKEILKEVKDQNEIPKGDYAKVKVYEAEVLSHQSGKDENDPQAGNKISWVVRPEKDKPGAIIHGPYADWDAGRYLIIYRIKLLEDASGKVVTVDSCVGGGTPLLGSREVNAEELEVGKYVSIPLLIEHPGGQIETRVIWDGNAPLAIDSITLFRMK